jgi:hypothetical protein
MGPPGKGDLEAGWLVGALRIAVPPTATHASVEFRIGGEVASLVDGDIVDGAIANSDAVVTGDAPGFYCLMVDRDLDAVSIGGSEQAVRDVLAALPPVPAVAAG